MATWLWLALALALELELESESKIQTQNQTQTQTRPSTSPHTPLAVGDLDPVGGHSDPGSNSSSSCSSELRLSSKFKFPLSFFLCAFSFMNSKRYKPMRNKRGGVSGCACYLCVAAYLLPIRCACALPRSTRRLPLFMELLDRRGAALCSASAYL